MNLIAGVHGVHGGGIYTSTNAGSSWVLRTNNAPASADWASVASSSDGERLAAVVEGSGIYTSTNSGSFWTPTSAPGTNWLSVASSANGTKLAACVGYGGGIYTSIDSGVSWAHTAAPSTNWYSVVSSADGNTLVAAVYGGGIYVRKASFVPAKATLIVTNGFIVGATVTDGGANYTNPPAIYFSGSGAIGASGYAQISNDGVVTNIVITSSGYGYPANAVIQIAPPVYPVLSIIQTNLQATATPLIFNGFIYGANITSQGLGYADFQTNISFSDASGTNASGYAQISKGSVTNIVISSTGSGYDSNTVINLPPPYFSVVTPTAGNLLFGESYQWWTGQTVSINFSSWTNYGPAFTATNTFETATTNWNTGTATQMFFRLLIQP